MSCSARASESVPYDASVMVVNTSLIIARVQKEEAEATERGFAVYRTGELNHQGGEGEGDHN